MELKKLSEHIWYMPFEEERDRPNLGYVTLIVTGTPISEFILEIIDGRELPEYMTMNKGKICG